MRAQDLLSGDIGVINVGLDVFARELAGKEVPVVQLDWSPPAARTVALRDTLMNLDLLDPSSGRSPTDVIEAANEDALQRMLAADPVLIDVRRADEVISNLGDHMLLHAGPPITWERMCGPMRGAIAGAIVLEGWAADLRQAEALADSGRIAFHPNHDFDAVGPMTGITSRSMPVMVVENRRFSNRAYCTLNEGLGKVMRFGGNDADVLNRLRWLASTLAPALSVALRECAGVVACPWVTRCISATWLAAVCFCGRLRQRLHAARVMLGNSERFSRLSPATTSSS